MADRIKFTLTLVSDNKVAAIRAMRNASGLGLKESKDIIDKCFDPERAGTYPSPILMSEAQFGRLLAESMVYGIVTLEKADRLFVVSNVSIVKDQDTVVLNLTAYPA